MTVTLLLTVVSSQNTLFDNSPKTSYWQAADIWTTVCFVFILAILAEYCIVIYLIKVTVNNLLFIQIFK